MNILRLLLIILLLALGSYIHAQTADLNKLFDKGSAYLFDQKNDSAKIVFKQLIAKLNISPFDERLKCKSLLMLAKAEEQSEQYEDAILTLFQLIEPSKKKAYVDILTKAYIIMALVQEKMNSLDSCAANLSRAQKLISSNNLDSLSSFYYSRFSSFYRMSGKEDSAKFYANLALTKAVQHDNLRDKGTAHLLLGILHRNDSIEKAIFHCRQSGEICKIIGDYYGHAAMMNHLSVIFLTQNKKTEALIYNDSSLRILGNSTFHWVYGSTILKRSNIFEKLGKLDSALVYARLGHEIIQSLELTKRIEKAAETEARYHDEKKILLIKEQQDKIRFESSQRLMLWVLLLTLLVFTLVLGLLYSRLIRSLKKSETQALIIAEKNKLLTELLEQQQILTGEVHHRVKNNLQIILGLLDLQIEKSKHPEIAQELNEVSDRIFSIAAVHELMYRKTTEEKASLSAYLHTLLAHAIQSLNLSKTAAPTVSVPDILLNSDTLVPFGIILNELLTNSAKHAKIANHSLEIDISIKPEAEGYWLIYKDNGSGLGNTNVSGTGFYLLQSMSRQLQGHVKAYDQEGAVFEIFFKEKNPL